jgi:hypothetical protein
MNRSRAQQMKEKSRFDVEILWGEFRLVLQRKVKPRASQTFPCPISWPQVSQNHFEVN